MISNFIQLPTSLLLDRVIPLLEIVDLVRLDTAVLNHNVRFQFIEQLRGAQLMTESLSVDDQVAQWLLNRNIKITTLQVHKKVKDLSIVKQIVAFVGTGVSLDSRSIVDIEAAKDFVRACESIKSLRLKIYVHTKSVLESVSQNCAALHTIHLQGSSNIEIAQFTGLTTGCKMLTEINVDDCYWLNDDYCSTIAVNCPQLQKLSMNFCYQCRDGSLQVLAQHCRHLRYLSVFGFKFLTDEGIGALTACSELRTFLLLNCMQITTDGIIKLAQGCNKLEEIGIPQCDERVDLAVAALVQYCPALTVLRCMSSHITDKSLLCLQNCPLLKTIEFPTAHTSTRALISLLDSCVYMQRLKVLLRTTVANIPLASNRFHWLENINFQHCTALTDAEFVPLISQCINLTELNLSICTSLTDAAVLAIAEHCTKLKDIKFSNNCSVSDAVVSTLAQRCSQLSSIDISGCKLLTDVAARDIAQYCPFMKHLNMSECVKITDAGIVEILQKCRHMRELMIVGCYAVTHKVLEVAVLYGARLRKLDIRGCNFYDAGTHPVADFCIAKPNCLLCS